MTRAHTLSFVPWYCWDCGHRHDARPIACVCGRVPPRSFRVELAFADDGTVDATAEGERTPAHSHRRRTRSASGEGEDGGAS